MSAHAPLKRRPSRIAAAMLAFFLSIMSVPSSASIDDAYVSALTGLGYISDTVTDLSIAVGNFQMANGLIRTGEIDAQTQSVLEGEQALSKTDYLTALAAAYAEKTVEKSSAYADVSQLQSALKELGYYAGNADGVFGEGTNAAVMCFQSANGLTPTGTADGPTLYRLYEGNPVAWDAFLSAQVSKKGDSGQHVRSLQRRLRTLGYFDGECTATFGDRTVRAVTEFQKKNALGETGEADMEFCRTLYSGTAYGPATDGILGIGDTGESVRTLQLNLNALGYYSGSVSGNYDKALFVATTFFQIANGLSPTGEADDALLTLTASEKAVLYKDAADALAATVQTVDDDALAAIAQAAVALVGTAADVDAEEIFPGFQFAQYAYAVSGVALVDPGALLSSAGVTYVTGDALFPGALLAFERAYESGVQICFAIAADAQTVLYVGDGDGFIVSSAIAQMEYDTCYVWDFRQQ